MTHWLRGKERDLVGEAKEAALRAPDPTIASNPLEGRDVALYVDGKRVSALSQSVTAIDEGDQVLVQFVTLTKAALEPEADLSLLQAWGQFKAGDTVIVRQPGKPQGGVLHISGVQPPATAGEPAFFVGRAMTRIVDWTTGETLAEPGEDCEIDTRYCATK